MRKKFFQIVIWPPKNKNFATKPNFIPVGSNSHRFAFSENICSLKQLFNSSSNLFLLFSITNIILIFCFASFFPELLFVGYLHPGSTLFIKGPVCKKRCRDQKFGNTLQEIGKNTYCNKRIFTCKNWCFSRNQQGLIEIPQ